MNVIYLHSLAIINWHLFMLPQNQIITLLVFLRILQNINSYFSYFSQLYSLPEEF